MIDRGKMYLKRNVKMVLALMIMIVIVSLSMCIAIGINSYTRHLSMDEKVQGLAKITLENMQSISSFILVVIVAATLLIMSLVFMFWIRQRKKEVGVLLSLGITKKNIIGQFIFELLLISVISITLSLVPANSLTTQINQRAISKASEDAKYGEKANREGVSQEKSKVFDTRNLDGKDIGKVYLSTCGVVLVTSMGALMGFIYKKPREILQELN